MNMQTGYIAAPSVFDAQAKQAFTQAQGQMLGSGALAQVRPAAPFQTAGQSLAHIVMSSEGSARRLEGVLVRLRGHVPQPAEVNKVAENIGPETPLLRLWERGASEAQENLRRVSAALDELESLLG
jgi:hypothetical protein